MSVNGIGAGYPMAGYTTRKTERNEGFGTAGFMEAVAEKTAKEDYANGAGIQKNGMMSHK